MSEEKCQVRPLVLSIVNTANQYIMSDALHDKENSSIPIDAMEQKQQSDDAVDREDAASGRSGGGSMFYVKRPKDVSATDAMM